MLFCGQCGLKLNAGDKQCPRCGTPVEPGAPIEDEAQADAPTVASPSLLGNMQTQAPANPNNVGDPQKLVLRPDQDAGSSNYGTQAAYEATRRMELPEQEHGATTPAAPFNPAIGPAYPAGFQQYPQNSGNYAPQDRYAEYPQSGSNYGPQGTAYPGPLQQGYQPYPPQERRPSTNARGRTAALLIILLGLLFILLAMTLFILERNNVFGSSNGGNSGGTAGTGAPTSTQRAQALIQQYYGDVNNKNYPAADTLWQESQRPSLTQFEGGYKNTVHDTVTFAQAAKQGDGTVKVSVTINALEKSGTDTTTTTTYTGYYVVGPQNGSWQLLQGTLNRA